MKFSVRFAATLGIVLFGLNACDDFWGPLENPADKSAPNYQGYDTLKEADDIAPLQSDAGTVPFIPRLAAVKIAGATRYQFQIAATADFANPVHTSSTEITSNEYSPTDCAGLATSVTYYWRVRAKIETEWGDWSTQPATFKLSPFAPATRLPANGDTLSDTTPDFSWGAWTGTQAYRFQLSTQDSFATTVTDISTLTGSSYTQSLALTNNTTYYWRLTARNADGVWSAWTSARGFAINWNPIITLTAPADAATTTDTTPLLDWSDATGAASYEIKIADSVANLTTATAVISALSSYQIASAFDNGATRYWRVCPINADGVPGAWRGDWSFTANAPVPVLLNPTANATLSDTTPEFNWGTLAGSQAYRFQLSTQDSFTTTLTDLDSLIGSSYTQSAALANDTSYYWRLAARNADGVWSAWTSARGFAVNWNPVITLTEPADTATTTDTTPLLDWRDVASAASYEIKIADSVADMASAATLTSATSSYQIASALANGATRYWRVRPINDDGVSGAWRGDWSFTVNTAVPTLSSPVTNATLSDTTPEFNWVTIVGTQAYRFQLSTQDSFTTTLTDLDTLTGSSYTQSAALANDTSYYWRLAARNADGVWSAWTSARGFTVNWNPAITLTAPADAAVTTDTTPLLDWSDVTSAASYEIKIADLVANLAAATVVTSATSSHQIVSALANGATRYWRVRPINADGVAGAWQGDWSFSANAAVPTLSSPVTNATINDTTPEFNWVTIVGTQAYRFQLSAQDIFTTTVTDLDTLTGSSYTQSAALANDTTYYWRLAARNADGVWSAWTSARSFTVSWNPTITLTAPADAAVTTDTTPLLDWSDVTGAASYEIKIADLVANLAAATVVTSATSSHQIVSALANGATRYWRVRPINADGVAGAWRGDWSFSANAAVPTLSSPADGTTLSDTTPDFSWGTIAGTQAYRFQLSTQNSFATTLADLDTLTGSSYTQSAALANDTSYYWRLTARNADGIWSAWTSARSFTVSWNPAITLTAPADAATTTDTTPLLDWSDAVGAASYEIKIADSAAGLATAATVTSATSSHQIASALPNGATRYWRVRPINVDGVAGAWRGDCSFIANISAGVVIGEDLQNPPTVSFSAIPAIVYDDQTFTVTATVTPNPDRYVWLLDGKVISGATAASYTLVGGDLIIGWHRLTVQAFIGAVHGTAKLEFEKIDDTAPFITMVFVPAGSFSNGTSTVNLSSFQMGAYEITQSQYQTVLGSNPASGYGVGANYPVYYVSWYDALVFCNKLSMQEGLTPVYTISGSTNPVNWGTVPTSNNSTWNAAVMNLGANGYRLPTEAEWEYAARGGAPVDSYSYAGSDTVGDVAWYYSNSNNIIHAVSSKVANKLGLYDMTGNVWEWCWDWYGSYPSGFQANPIGAFSGSHRVTRGGSYGNFASDSTVSTRNYNEPDHSSYIHGFRVVRRH